MLQNFIEYRYWNFYNFFSRMSNVQTFLKQILSSSNVFFQPLIKDIWHVHLIFSSIRFFSFYFHLIRSEFQYFVLGQKSTKYRPYCAGVKIWNDQMFGTNKWNDRYFGLSNIKITKVEILDFVMLYFLLFYLFKLLDTQNI